MMTSRATQEFSHELVNKLVEREAFINSVWRDCTQLKDEFLFDKLTVLCGYDYDDEYVLACFVKQ